MAFRLMLVDSHHSRASKANYFPWHPTDGQCLGWEVKTEEGDTHYVYFVPALDESEPTVRIYWGPHGDPEKDQHVDDIVVRRINQGDQDNGN